MKDFKTWKHLEMLIKKIELLENNHIDYLNPICPHCNSKKINKQEYREKQLIIGEKKPVLVYLRRYLCKSCKKNLQHP